MATTKSVTDHLRNVFETVNEPPYLAMLACKWEITTLIVIFDDRPSSTVVKKSFQSIY